LSDNRNMILAFALSLLIWFGWSFASERFFPQPKHAAIVAGAGTSQNSSPTIPAAPGSIPAADGGEAVRPLATVAAETPRLRIDTPRLLGSLNLKGARVDDLVLKTYAQTIDKASPPVRLFSPSGTTDAYFAQFGWAGVGAPGADTVWTASGSALTPTTPVTLSWTNPAGAVFEILLSVDDHWLFTAKQRVRNAGPTPLTMRSYGLVGRTGIGHETDANNLHVGPLGVVNGKLMDTEVAYKKLRDNGAQSLSSTGGWLGITEKYWLAAVIPDQASPVAMRFSANPGDRFQTDYLAGPVTIAPGATVETTARLFAGAKEVDTLTRYRDTYGIPLFERAVDWGWFRVIAQPIYMLLDFLFKLSGNFGVAIIGLTLCVRALMFPIAQRQFASMAKMRVVAPRLKELQERYKDDKPKLQTEMMALYAKEKVNPVAGCLPIFIQIPVFYALYKTLLISTEMRHQPFILWIKDLSAPDPVTPLNLFGLIPWTPPHMIALGVLPIILGVTMWLQQRLNPAVMDPVQKQVFAFMPWVFMFIMAPFAAGLQLYWIINNITSIAQQYVMLRKYPMPATPTVVAP
jgi:YidC/Oxa1 family membrane protein insertase